MNRLLETLKRFFWLLQEINKRRNMEISNHKPYSRCRVWRCDVTTSNSIQDGGAVGVNILVFDLRVQLQHYTYQRKTLLFALIKVSTFICKREISGLSSPLTNQSACGIYMLFYNVLYPIYRLNKLEIIFLSNTIKGKLRFSDHFNAFSKRLSDT